MSVTTYPQAAVAIASSSCSNTLGACSRRQCLPLHGSFLPTSLHLKVRSWSASQTLTASQPSPSYVLGCRASLKALVFDCDGVILESEDLHRRAYNAAFSHFNVVCPGSTRPLEWTPEFYDQLQNQIGGGKPKMRWYFGAHGWPSSTLFPSAPASDTDQSVLIDTLQDWKTDKYKDIISSGTINPRPGVLMLMDEARAKGNLVAVCSAATKSSVVFCLTNLLGKDRFEQLDCFLAGDDVQKKKPDPSIYIEAAKEAIMVKAQKYPSYFIDHCRRERLNVPAEECLVVEDSVIGLQAALGAGMKCIISYTSSTAEQDFSGASAVYADLGNIRFQHLQELMESTVTC